LKGNICVKQQFLKEHPMKKYIVKLSRGQRQQWEDLISRGWTANETLLW